MHIHNEEHTNTQSICFHASFINLNTMKTHLKDSLVVHFGQSKQKPKIAQFSFLCFSDCLKEQVCAEHCINTNYNLHRHDASKHNTGQCSLCINRALAAVIFAHCAFDQDFSPWTARLQYFLGILLPGWLHQREWFHCEWLGRPSGL